MREAARRGCWLGRGTPRAFTATVLAVAAALAATGVIARYVTGMSAAAFARSNPMPGVVLSSSPARLDIYTDADLAASALNAIDVRAGDLREVDQRDISIDPLDPRHLSVGLQPALGAGRYVVSFVAAQAGDVVARGQFSFYIGVAPSSANRAADARLSVGDGVEQPSSTGRDPTAALAVGVAVGLAGTITAGTAIALRRRAVRDRTGW